MSTSKVDTKRRIVLPGGNPGDIFDIQQHGDGLYLLVRREKPEVPARLSRNACLKAMREAPLRPAMSWDELEKLTREP